MYKACFRATCRNHVKRDTRDDRSRANLLTTCRGIVHRTDYYYRDLKSRKEKKFRFNSARTISRYFFLCARSICRYRESIRETAISACCPPQLFRDKQQLDATLRLKLATRRTARKLIDAQENSGGGEEAGRQDAGAYPLFTWITRDSLRILTLYRRHRSFSPTTLSYEEMKRDLASRRRINPFESRYCATGRRIDLGRKIVI